VAAKGPLVIVLALVEHDGLFLVQRRATEPFEGAWEFPGGKLEYGETPEEGVRREVREERGLDVKVEGLETVVSHVYPPPGSHVVLLVYRARPIGPAPEGPEAPGMRWVTLDELARLEMPRANERIVEWLRRRSES
jgi:mutator protein MutT